MPRVVQGMAAVAAEQLGPGVAGNSRVTLPLWAMAWPNAVVAGLVYRTRVEWVLSMMGTRRAWKNGRGEDSHACQHDVGTTDLPFQVTQRHNVCRHALVPRKYRPLSEADPPPPSRAMPIRMPVVVAAVV